MLQQYTLSQLLHLQEEEDHIELKEAKRNFSYNGYNITDPSSRRKCLLGYMVALCNEGGGILALGIKEHKGSTHEVVGTEMWKDRLGQLESDIYRDLGIRPSRIYELYEDEINRLGRVLVIQVPSRPVGRYFSYEGAPLMRVGEDLKPMDPETLRRIVMEQEPDYSATICHGLTMDDLDPNALQIMKQKYAAKQNNRDFLTLSDAQIISDLALSSAKGLTYAALILLGKQEALLRYLPQCKVVFEYRSTENKIECDWRKEFLLPFFLMIDELWQMIDARNEKKDIQDHAYIFNIARYNEQVVREAINNAIAHRNYSTQADTFIKLSPHLLVVLNSGAFPYGVSIKNILSAPSTPRNRLLADILSKTGVVERSGQGVDKIFRFTLSEGKASPSYAASDDFNTELHIPTHIDDLAFAKFLEIEQRDLPNEERLSVQEIITLHDICQGTDKELLPETTVASLLRRGLIEKTGRTRAQRYILNKTYHQYSDQKGAYVHQTMWTEEMAFNLIIQYFETYNSAAMKDFAELLTPGFSRMQVRTLVARLVQQEVLLKLGEGNKTTYELNPNKKDR